MTTETPTAPAGAPTETVTPERVAAEKSDFSAFQEATRERRSGKAPAPITREKVETPAAATEGASGRQPAAGKDGQPAKGPTPADREADARLATRIREAVDTATADSTRRLRELEEQLAAARRTPEPKADGTGAAAKTTERKGPLTKAEIAAYQALPGAPKLEDKAADGSYLYDTQGEHAVALAEFIRETREAEKATQATQGREYAERVKREAARVSTFSERIDAFKRENEAILVDNGKGGKAIPLSPEVGGLHGYAKLAEINADRQSKGLQPLPATVDHAIAEELYDSELPMQVARYLTEHPEELATLRKATAPAQLTRLFGSLEERVRGANPAKQPPAATPVSPTSKTPTEARREAEAAVERSVSSARPLNGNLGKAGGSGADPEQVAIDKNDYAGFAETQRARRLELLEGRRARR